MADGRVDRWQMAAQVVQVNARSAGSRFNTTEPAWQKFASYSPTPEKGDVAFMHHDERQMAVDGVREESNSAGIGYAPLYVPPFQPRPVVVLLCTTAYQGAAMTMPGERHDGDRPSQGSTARPRRSA